MSAGKEQINANGRAPYNPANGKYKENSDIDTNCCCSSSGCICIGGDAVDLDVSTATILLSIIGTAFDDVTLTDCAGCDWSSLVCPEWPSDICILPADYIGACTWKKHLAGTGNIVCDGVSHDLDYFLLEVEFRGGNKFFVSLSFVGLDGFTVPLISGIDPSGIFSCTTTGSGPIVGTNCPMATPVWEFFATFNGC